MFEKETPPELKFRELQEIYSKNEKRLKLPGSFDFYNEVEREVLGFNSPMFEREKQNEQGKSLDLMINYIKQLAMELSRQNPTEWNNFMDVSLWWN